MVLVFCYTQFHDLLNCAKFHQKDNCINIMITCAPIQYNVIFRALKIAIVK